MPTVFFDIDTQIDKRLSDFHLLLQIHAAAGRLFAVAQRRVENFDLSGLSCIGHGKYSLWADNE